MDERREYIEHLRDDMNMRGWVGCVDKRFCEDVRYGLTHAEFLYLNLRDDFIDSEKIAYEFTRDTMRLHIIHQQFLNLIWDNIKESEKVHEQ